MVGNYMNINIKYLLGNCERCLEREFITTDLKKKKQKHLTSLTR